MPYIEDPDLVIVPSPYYQTPYVFKSHDGIWKVQYCSHRNRRYYVVNAPEGWESAIELAGYFARTA